jgi:hypothetical protein
MTEEKDTDATQKEPKLVEEDESGSSKNINNSSSRRSNHGKGMDSSVFRFSNLNFTVKKGSKETKILSDVSHTVKWGRT